MSSIDWLTGFITAEAATPNLWVFRILFSSACLFKCATEIKRGYLQSYRPTTWLYFVIRVKHLRNRNSIPGNRTYLVGHAVRLTFALLLFLGYLPNVAAAVLRVVFVLEAQVMFRFHTNYFSLIAGSLVFAPTMPDLRTVLSWSVSGMDFVRYQFAQITGPATSVILVVSTTIMLYWGSAYRKFSRVFLDGTVVWATLRYVAAERPYRHHVDGWYPQSLLSVLDRIRPGHPLWRLTMGMVVALEVALPVLLAFPASWPFGIVLGLVMHMAFTLLLPITLLPFSLVTVGTYLLFPVLSAV